MRAEARTLDEELLHHETLVERHGQAGRPGRLTERTVWTLVLGAAILVSLAAAGVGTRELVNPGGWVLIRRFLAAAVSPELGRDFLALTWDAALTTISYAVLGTAVSVVLGIAGGFLASQVWWASPGGDRAGRGPWLAARGALALPRGIHEAVWGLFLVGILGLNPLVAVLAIGIPYGAITAKVFSELLDESPREAWRALRTAGTGRMKAFLYSLGPAAFPDMLSYIFYRFECSIRAAAILGIIGAGGLGFQLALSFQSLRYGEMWTLLYALVVVSGLADLWSTSLRRRSRSFGCRPPRPGATRPMPLRDRKLTWSVVAGAALVAVAALHLRINPASLWAPRTRRLLSGMAASAFPPDLGGSQLAGLIRPSLETLQMSILAASIAFCGGLVAAFFAARRFAASGRRSPERLLEWGAHLAARTVLLFCRAIPPPVWAFVLLFVLFPGPLPGALALGVYTFGILGRLMAEVVENAPPAPARAIRAQGASRAQSFLYGVLPRTLPRFAAFGIYRWEVTIRETVVVGLVGAGGLGRLLSEQMTSFHYPGVLVTLFALIALTFAVDLAGASLRRAFR